MSKIVEQMMKNLLAEYEKREERYAAAFEKAKVIMIEYDPDKDAYTYDQHMGHILAGDFEGKGLKDVLLSEKLVHADDYVEIERLFMPDDGGDNRTEEVRLKGVKGGWTWFRISASYMRDEKGHLDRILYILCDITDEKAYQKEIRYISDFDRMTGLYNRNGFYTKARDFMLENPNGRYAIVRLDIEKFRVVNSVLGIEAGDYIIKYVADELKFLVAGNGVIGRIHGDVFVVCMPYDNVQPLGDFLPKVAEIQPVGIQYEIEIATGVYVVDSVFTPVELMCDLADMAVKSVKGDYNRKYEFYEEGQRETMLAEQRIVQSMEKALGENQFKVYFQPQYNIDNGKIIAAEALVRWVHPTEGFITPDKFIPIFEKNGFITLLDQYVLEQVCQFLDKWRSQGKKLFPISVNVSRVDLFNMNFCEIIYQTARRYHIDPQLIELEITETAYMDNPDLLIEKTETLQNYGFKVLMDDFGSGYSCLNMLKDVPVDILKIDLKFLTGIVESKRGGSILKSIVSMARELKIPTIAEGVENEAQVEILSQLGCDFAQGYHYNRPMSAGEFEDRCLIAG